MSDAEESQTGVKTGRLKLALLLFAAIGAFFLLAEHRAHVQPVLPWLLLAACPLLHLFMHHGKHRHHGDDATGTGGRKDRGGGHE